MWQAWDSFLLLEILRQCVSSVRRWPTLRREWDELAERYMSRAKEVQSDYPMRDGDAVKERWRKMHNTKADTGNPEPPVWLTDALALYKDSQETTGQGVAGGRFNTAHRRLTSSSSSSQISSSSASQTSVDEQTLSDDGEGDVLEGDEEEEDMLDAISEYQSSVAERLNFIDNSQILFSPSAKAANNPFGISQLNAARSSSMSTADLRSTTTSDDVSLYLSPTSSSPNLTSTGSATFSQHGASVQSPNAPAGKHPTKIRRKNVEQKVDGLEDVLKTYLQTVTEQRLADERNRERQAAADAEYRRAKEEAQAAREKEKSERADATQRAWQQTVVAMTEIFAKTVATAMQPPVFTPPSLPSQPLPLPLPSQQSHSAPESSPQSQPSA